MCKVSIIVPVYNCAKYLDRCIKSILNQTHKNLELILVDDGSTDKSGDICDNYAKIDSRVIVIHQANEGVVSARKTGVKIASGEWLQFVDADDWLSINMISSLLKLSDDREIVWCDVTLYMNGQFHGKKLNYVEAVDELLSLVLEEKTPGWLFNKIIRKEFYEKCNLNIPRDCIMMEDVLMLVQMLIANPRMNYVPKSLYIYNRDNENAFTSKSKNALLFAFPALEAIEKCLIKNSIFDKYKLSYSNMLIRYKIAIAKEYGIVQARKKFRYAHKNWKVFPMSYFIKTIYWFFFNGGVLGSILFSFYNKYIIKKFKN